MILARRAFLLGATTYATCSLAPAAFALTEQQELIDKARISFEKLAASPEFSELPGYLKRSKAVMIFPSLFKAGFVIGGEGGAGVLMVRDAQRGWSQPAFYTLAAGSVGLQIGGQLSEAIFTIMSEKALNAVLDNQMKLGGNVSMAAGPIGKGVGADTTTNFSSDVYTFAKTAGLFGGVSFEGAGILKKDSWNRAYYGQGASPYAIVIQRKFENPNTKALVNAVSAY
jgi:lipid-binding SYLF domain-containing protein